MEGVEAGAKQCRGKNGEGGERFSDPLCVASGGEANDIEGEELEFCGKAVKIFFFVLVKVGKDGLFELDDVFDGKEVVEGKVSA